MGIAGEAEYSLLQKENMRKLINGKNATPMGIAGGYGIISYKKVSNPKLYQRTACETFPSLEREGE